MTHQLGRAVVRRDSKARKTGANRCVGCGRYKKPRRQPTAGLAASVTNNVGCVVGAAEAGTDRNEQGYVSAPAREKGDSSEICRRWRV